MSRNQALHILVAVLLFAVITVTQREIDKQELKSLAAGQKLLIFPKPAVLKMASLGHKNLVADYYWLKAIQYLGSCLILQLKPVRLYQYADFITDIDPKFFEAYYYPAVVMTIDRIDPLHNIALLEKGRKNLPEKGEIAYLLGFGYYYFMGERLKAAQNLKEAARLRNYAPYAILASRILAEDNNPELSLSILNELANDPKLANWSASMNQMMAGLKQQKILDQLNQKIAEYENLKHRYPEKLEELVSAGLLSSLPQDPLGGEFFINPQTRQAESTKKFYTGVYRPEGWK
jgi:hypothetical protein